MNTPSERRRGVVTGAGSGIGKAVVRAPPPRECRCSRRRHQCRQPRRHQGRSLRARSSAMSPTRRSAPRSPTGPTARLSRQFRRRHRHQVDLRGDCRGLATRADDQRRGDLLPLPGDRAAAAARRSDRQSLVELGQARAPPSRPRPMPRRRRRSCRSPAPSLTRSPRGRCGSTRSAPASSTRRCRRRCSATVATMRGTTAEDWSAARKQGWCRSAAAPSPDECAGADLVPAVGRSRLHDRTGDQFHRRPGDVVSTLTMRARKTDEESRSRSARPASAIPRAPTSSTTAASSSPTPMPARSASGTRRPTRPGTYAYVGGGPNACMLGTRRLRLLDPDARTSGWVAPVHRPPSIQKTSPTGKVEILVTEADGVKFDGPNDLTFGARRPALLHRLRRLGPGRPSRIRAASSSSRRTAGADRSRSSTTSIRTASSPSPTARSSGSNPTR